MAVKYHNLTVREKKLIFQKSFKMWSLCQTVFKTKQIDSKQRVNLRKCDRNKLFPLFRMNLFYAKLRESYQRQELLILREYLGSPPFSCGVCVAHLFSFLCCVICFVFHLPLSCVSSVASLFLWIVHSWLPLRFCLTYIKKVLQIRYL